MASWFYVRNNQQVGPVSIEQLQGMVQSGELRAEDRVWGEGMPDWVKVATVPELQTARSTAEAVGVANAAPAAALSYQSVGVGEVMANSRAIDMLRQTGPWVRFMSVLMFIGSALMIVGGVAMMAIGAMTLGHPENMIIGIIYIPFAILYIMPAVFLGRYASNIKRLNAGRQPGDLEAALESQKSFWKFVGIMAAVLLCLYVVIIILAVAFGAFFAARMHT